MPNVKTEKTPQQKAAATALRIENEITKHQTLATNVQNRISAINDAENNDFMLNETNSSKYDAMMDEVNDCLSHTAIADVRLFGETLQSLIDTLVRRTQDPNFIDMVSRTRNTQVKTADQIAQEEALLASRTKIVTPIAKSMIKALGNNSLGARGYDDSQTVDVDGVSHNPSNVHTETTLIKMLIGMLDLATQTQAVKVETATNTENAVGDNQ